MKNSKGFIGILVAIIIAVAVLGSGAYLITRPKSSPIPNLQDQSDATVNTQSNGSNFANQNAGWKTYANAQYGFEFKYPEKLSLSTANGIVSISHSIPFENRDGGCDMIGDSKLSPTLTDFNLSFNVVSGEVNPPYVDGSYSKGTLNGKWAYMGAEGCGETKYYFPISGNRTLVVTKSEVQILSNIVTQEVRAKVLAVPGVIFYDESKALLDQILSTFKFTEAKIVTEGYISDQKVGIFSIGEPIPTQTLLSQLNYSIRETTIFPEGMPTKLFIVSRDGKDLLTFSKGYLDNIWNIKVISSEFKTKEGIGVGSTISDFIKAYPNYRLWYTAEEGEKFILNIAKDAPTPHFFLAREDLIDSKKTFYNKEIKISDFKTDAKIASVSVYYSP